MGVLDMWRVQWAEDKTRETLTIQELDALLAELARGRAGQRGMLVNIESPNGDVLTVGVGGDVSVVSYMRQNGKPPYVTTVGDPEAEGIVVFDYLGQWTEIPKRNTITFERAREILRRFLWDGTLDPNVEWEEL